MLIQRFRSMLAKRHNVRAHFWQSCSNYTQQVSGLFLSILLARLLVPADFGEFAYAGAVLMLFMLPATWSLSPQVVAEVRFHPEIINDALHYSRIFVTPRIILAACGCIFLFVTKGWHLGLIGLILAIPLVGGDFISVLRAGLEGQGAFKANFFDSLLTASSTAAISIPAAICGMGVWSLALPAVPLFIAQAILYSLMSGFSFRPRAPITQRSYFRSGTALWLCACGESALLRSDKFLLGQSAGMNSLGDYNRAFNFSPLAARALNSLLTSATVASLTAVSDRPSQRKLLAKSGFLLVLAGSANFVLWWFFADPLVPLLFGSQWQSAIPVFEAMAPLSLAISVAYLPTTLAMAQRAYAQLAAVRILTLFGFIIMVLVLNDRMSGVLMAWLLQLTLVAQGVGLALVLRLLGRRTIRD